MHILYLIPPILSPFTRGKWLYPIALLSLAVSLIGGITQHWGVYHYYLGSKFFAEVGYFDLYECSALATGQTALFRRDLHTYEFTSDYPDCDKSKWTGERWEEFTAYLRHDERFGNGMMRDKGLNATPTWVAIGEKLSFLSPAVLVWTDVIMLVMAAAVALPVVGLRRVILALLFFTMFWGTLGRVWGHVGQWWWLSLLIMGECLLHRRRDAGGILIGLSAALAIFPIFLLIGRSRKILLHGTIGLILGLLVGAGSSRGLNIYPEFVDNMLLHSSQIRHEPYNLGFLNQVSLTFTNADTLDGYLTCFRGGTCTEYQFPSLQWWWLLPLPLLMFTKFSRIYGLLTLSRYYWQMLILIPLFEDERSVQWLFAANAATYILKSIDREIAWQYLGVIWMVYFFAASLQSFLLHQASRYSLMKLDFLYTEKRNSL